MHMPINFQICIFDNMDIWYFRIWFFEFNTIFIFYISIYFISKTLYFGNLVFERVDKLMSIVHLEEGFNAVIWKIRSRAPLSFPSLLTIFLSSQIIFSIIAYFYHLQPTVSNGYYPLWSGYNWCYYCHHHDLIHHNHELVIPILHSTEKGGQKFPTIVKSFQQWRSLNCQKFFWSHSPRALLVQSYMGHRWVTFSINKSLPQKCWQSEDLWAA